MNNNLRKLSPFALGVALGCYQVIQPPLVRAASLGTNSNASSLTSLAPSVPATAPANAAGGCSPTSLQTPSQSGALPSQGSAELGTAPSSLGYQSISVPPASNGTGGTLVAQLVPDENCCEFGGTADCELGGVPPVGGIAGAGFPFAALAGLLPAALIPLIPGDNSDTPSSVPPLVPEPSSTAGIAAGVGMLALWFGRRIRTGQNSSV